MIWSDTDILMGIERGEISIDPFYPERVQPSSYDLTLGSEFRVFTNYQRVSVDPQNPPDDLTCQVIVGREGFVLHPGEFALATTVEYLTFGTAVVGILNGKSSLGRVGLLIHSTAGYFDPGFEGQATLELSNVSNLPIVLTPGMSIGQMVYTRTVSPAMKPYGHPDLKSRYQGQTGATAPRPTPSQPENPGNREGRKEDSENPIVWCQLCMREHPAYGVH